MILALLTGCQTFRPAPLDLADHQEAWRARHATDGEVRAFAERLAGPVPDPAPFDPADGLSLAEGEVVALVFNPDLRMARLRAGVAGATARHAGRWDDPTFGLEVLKVTEGIPDPWIIGSSLSVTVPVSGRLRAERARAEAAFDAELERVAEAEWKLRWELRGRWLSWSGQRLRMEQAETIVNDLGAIVEVTSRLAETGELPRTEAALFSIERKSQRADLERLRAEVAEGEQEIRAILGLAPGAPVDLVPALAAVEPPGDKEEPDETSPTLSRLRAEYAVAERTLQREVRKQFPDLAIGPQAESDEGQSRIGFIGAIPVPLLNANKGGIAEARAGRDLSRAAFETGYERIAGRLGALRTRLQGERARREVIESGLVPLVDRQVADARQLLHLGEGGSLVLLESLVRAQEAKLMLIDLQVETAETHSEIRYLLGPTTPPQSPGTTLPTP